MSNSLIHKGIKDLREINLDQDWEVDFWVETLGVSQQQLRKAVSEVGACIEDIIFYLNC